MATKRAYVVATPRANQHPSGNHLENHGEVYLMTKNQNHVVNLNGQQKNNLCWCNTFVYFGVMRIMTSGQ